MGRMLLLLFVAVLCTVIGLGSGWFAARQKSGAGGGHAEHAGEGPGEKPDDHEAEKPKLSTQTLANLGVTVADAETTTWVRYRSVPAVVATPVTARLPLHAPLGGRVIEVHVQEHQVVTSGSVAVTLVRDALPRPNLALTDQILKPAIEDYHQTVVEFRKARGSAGIIQSEIERIQKFAEAGGANEVAVIPRKNLIDLRYDLIRAEQEVQGAEAELRRHGCTDEGIADIAAGGAVPGLGQQVWRQALQQNGLWPPEAETLFQALPEKLRRSPWAVAAVGEITAASLAVAELSGWFAAQAEAGDHFLEIAGLLQQGNSLASIQLLHSQGALEPVMQIRLPSVAGVEDWDVRHVHVKPGQRVEPGQPLAELENLRSLLLKSEPVGGETASILAALREDSEIEAVPLVPETGPAMKGLRVSRVTSDESGHGAVAYLAVENTALQVRADPRVGGKTRTWNLREGVRYFLRVPLSRLNEVFVIPSAAVADDGPDKVVYVQEGDSFKPAKVVVLHLDDEVAVLDAKKSEIFPGDRLVQRGAFGLGLALKAGSGGADPHAGHGH